MSDADVERPGPTEPDAAGQSASIAPSSSRPAPRTPDPTTLQPETASAGQKHAPPVRPELRNWAVVDLLGDDPALTTETDLDALPAIDGTAQVVEQVAAAAEGPSVEALPPRNTPEQDFIDPILIAGLPHREIHVQPGGQATLVVSLLNNGPVAATFDVHLEGWVRESWLEEEAQRRLLVQPGERAALPIAISPPRDGSVTAGALPVVVIVRSPEHPRRRTRLVASLVVEPFTDFAVGRLDPHQAVLGSFRRSAHFVLPVSNLGNHPLRLVLHGQLLGLPGRVDFTDSLESRGKAGPAWLTTPATLNLEPRQSTDIYVRASAVGAPLLAAQPQIAALRVSATAEEERRLPRTASAQVTWRPLLRPWQLGVVVAASLALLVVTGLLALAARLLLDSPARSAALPLTGAQPAPIVIVLEQPAPIDSSAPSAGSQTTTPQVVVVPGPDSAAPSQPDAAQPVAGGGGVPLVQPNQITRPGETAPQPVQPIAAPVGGDGGLVVSAASVTQPGQSVAVQPSAVSVASVPLAPAAPQPVAAPDRQMTYAEMFRDVALQYDLDWRLLAAQAYIESGFDSLALGSDGDMGLMQVLPGTWREWAPVVSASDPFDAYSSALVAAVYHDYLRAELGKRGLPQAQWMLVAYNWGIDRLNTFLDEGGTWDQLPPVRRNYADEILRIARTIP